MAGTGGGKKAVKEGQENQLKEKGKARGKRHDSSPEQHEKEEGTKKKKRVRRLTKDPPNKNRQTEPLKGASQPHVYHFTGCLKEKNVTNHQANTRSSIQTAPSQVPARGGPAQTSPKKDSFPALERAKATRPTGSPLPLRGAASPTRGRVNVAPSTPIHPYEEGAPPLKTMSRAQALALVENMALHLRLNTPSCKAHLQGLAALVPETKTFASLRKPKLEGEANCLKENVTWSMDEEGRRFVDGRPTTLRQCKSKTVQWQYPDHQHLQKKEMGCNHEDHACDEHIHKHIEELELGLVSVSSLGPDHGSFLDAWRQSTETWANRPSRTQTLSALHSAIARRDEMRKEMERRVEQEREDKKVAYTQEKHKKFRRKCTLCGN